MQPAVQYARAQFQVGLASLLGAVSRRHRQRPSSPCELTCLELPLRAAD